MANLPKGGLSLQSPTDSNRINSVFNEAIRGNGKLPLSSSVLRAVVSASPNPSLPSGQIDAEPFTKDDHVTGADVFVITDDHFIKVRLWDGERCSPWVTVYSQNGSLYGDVVTNSLVLEVDVDTLLFSSFNDVESLFIEIDSSLPAEQEIHLAQWNRSYSEVRSWEFSRDDRNLKDSFACKRVFESKREFSLPVPFRSQMIETKVPPKDVCLPTSLAMVLEYYGIRVQTSVVANACYDSYHRIYGNWLRACFVAGSYGLKARVLAVDSLEDLLPFLNEEIPLIVSISFEIGGLSGAPVAKTRGHLLVIRGVDVDGRILVCDPAGRTKTEGYISYDPVQFAKAMKGVAIIIEKLPKRFA